MAFPHLSLEVFVLGLFFLQFVLQLVYGGEVFLLLFFQVVHMRRE